MNWFRFVRFPVLLVSVLCVAAILLNGPLAAADPGSAVSRGSAAQDIAPTATPRPLVDASGGDNETSVGVLGKGELPGFLIALLVFGLSAFGILFLYLYKSQDRFYGAFSGMARAGQAPQVIGVAPFAGAARPGTLGDAPKPPPPSIKGPATVTTGVQSGEFTVEQGGEPVADAQWSVSPASAAAVNPISGATARLVATTTGAFELTATVPGTKQHATIQVAAMPAETRGATLPFVGTGFGSIAVTILLVVGVIALAFNGSLGGEAVATFFGGLLGYVFGTAVSGGTTRDGK